MNLSAPFRDEEGNFINVENLCIIEKKTSCCLSCKKDERLKKRKGSNICLMHNK